ncbi:hypothetical protein NUU61_006215 [Penicillium alfredii]|uniref:C2H2-type domain-containing protein n=1 Tax=Penicillium alfredii TaxID=1506179 RepID=A0A9W9F0R3_9EURO|nr:uncharacterized protein NUU61_006215 [Penicillium alfredii]KAJ5091345.1 hypothetical protein NUU61_006215 [Penicillium alfredii]
MNTSFDGIPPASPWVPEADANNLAAKLIPQRRDSIDFQQRTQLSHPSTGVPRRPSRYFIPRSTGNVIPIYIPNSAASDPLQRWQESPPEDEPASMSAIMNAVKNTPVHRRRRSNQEGRPVDAFQHSRARPHGPRRRAGKINPDGGKRHLFCCTFCCDRFKSKYDWVRHEKSLHLNVEAWFCAPYGASAFSPITGRAHCAYCNALDPSRDHLSDHNYEACQGVSTLPLIDDWKVETWGISSRCGFCDTAHFRKGLTMKDWQGDHGLPPAITAQLTNAFPPWLIGSESQSIIPFSATNTDVRDHYAQVSLRTLASNDQGHGPTKSSLEPVPSSDGPPSWLENFLDIFTRRLSHYAQEQMQCGVAPTDEMFQQESRRIVFGL